MPQRFYLSNIRSRWPIERQEALLDEHAPGWRKMASFRDILSPRKRLAHSAAALVERSNVLRPTSRRGAETICVASLAVLAWTTTDLFGVIAALAGRGATLHAFAENVVIAPDAGAAVIAGTAEVFASAIRRATGDGPEKGGRISAAKREASAKARCETIRERWALSSDEYPTLSLLSEANVSRATAKKYLGYRDKAQEAHKRRAEQAERNRSRRKAP